MNIFRKVAEKQTQEYFKLGTSSIDEDFQLARLNAMSSLTSGKGFRQDKKELKTDFQGMTRGEKKREHRKEYIDKVKKQNLNGMG